MNISLQFILAFALSLSIPSQGFATGKSRPEQNGTQDQISDLAKDTNAVEYTKRNTTEKVNPNRFKKAIELIYSEFDRQIKSGKFDLYTDFYVSLESVKKKGIEQQLLRESFDSLLPVGRDPSSPAATENVDQRLVALELFKENFGSTLFPERKIDLIAPSTPPGSGAQVYLIKDTDNNMLASFKIQSGTVGGLNEIISSVVADKILGNISHVKTLAIGRLPENRYFIIQDGAQGSDIDSIIKKHPLKAKAVIRKTAEFMALFHSPSHQNASRNSLPRDPLYPSFHYPRGPPNTMTQSQCKQFSDNVRYEIEVTQKRIVNNEMNIEFKGNYSRLKDQIEKTKDNYEKLVNECLADQLCPPGIFPAPNHGDAHGGNFFFDGQRITMIDYGNYPYSIDLKNSNLATADAANDVGRMLGALQVQAIKLGNSVDQATQIGQDFLAEYERAKGITDRKARENFHVAVNFYRNRFFGLQSSDVEGVKFSSKIVDKSTLRQHLFELWSKQIGAKLETIPEE